MDYDIKDIAFSKKGKLRIEWASRQMPVLNLIKKRLRGRNL
jgi:S-adenosylhomocysteine hydrolase